ncbi:MAG: aldehyde dehydrogenase family protein [Deltaproteobacteria bacterium]|nr:aldehyde dehydrogenase family protein [Deltaproteobacteria bacterium]
MAAPSIPDPKSSDTPLMECRNPATGEVIGTVPVDSRKVVRGKVARARKATTLWQQLSFSQRRNELLRWRREMAERIDEFADLIHRENGKPILDAVGEVLLALNHLDHAAKHAAKALAPEKVGSGILANFRSKISYHPMGVVGVIGPWNYPIYTPIGAMAYALAGGNACVFKPSELTSLVGMLIEETAHASLSIPDIVIVTTGGGETGAALAKAGVDKISFTGSTATGKKVMKAAAENLTPVVLELGGKDPMIVTDDADVEAAADAAVFGAMTNAGQTCIAIERCYVHENVYDRFLDRVVDGVQQLDVGADGDAKIGAMTSREQVDIVRDHIEDAVAKGAKVVTGGPERIRESFVEPTVLVDVTDDMKIMKDETFGPVLPIMRVSSVDEAVSKANSLPYGLGSTVFAGKNAQSIADRIKAGMTAINSALSFAAVPNLPFGGVGESGLGRLHGDQGFREFTRIQAVTEQRFALPINLFSFRTPDNMTDHLRKMAHELYGGGVVDKATSLWSSLWGGK